MSNADRYAKIVYWSEEDQCFIGCCPKLVLGGCHGDDPKAVFAELCIPACPNLRDDQGLHRDQTPRSRLEA